eukprot:175644_1
MRKQTKKRKLKTSNKQNAGISYSFEGTSKLFKIVNAFALHDTGEIVYKVLTSDSPEDEWNANKEAITKVLSSYSFGYHIEFKDRNCFTDIINSCLKNIDAHMEYYQQQDTICMENQYVSAKYMRINGIKKFIVCSERHPKPIEHTIGAPSTLQRQLNNYFARNTKYCEGIKGFYDRLQDIKSLPMFKNIYIDHKSKAIFNSNNRCNKHQKLIQTPTNCKGCKSKGCRLICESNNHKAIKMGYQCTECKQLRARIKKSLQRIEMLPHKMTALNKLNTNQLLDVARGCNQTDKILTKEIIELRATLAKYHNIVSRDADGNKLIRTIQLVLNNWDRFDIYFQKFPQNMDHIYDQFNAALHKQNGEENGIRWSPSSKLLHSLQRMHLSSYETIKHTNIQHIPTKPTLNKERQDYYFPDGMTHELCDKMKKERAEFCRDRNITTEPYWTMQLDGMSVAEVMSYNPKNHSINGHLSEMYDLFMIYFLKKVG